LTGPPNARTTYLSARAAAPSRRRPRIPSLVPQCQSTIPTAAIASAGRRRGRRAYRPGPPRASTPFRHLLLHAASEPSGSSREPDIGPRAIPVTGGRPML
jgi:hypothetical protein